MILTCDNVITEATRGGNPEWPLTHRSDLTGRGLAVKATRICSQNGCSARVRAKGLCSTHYNRQWRHGDPNIVLKATLPVRRGPDSPRWQGDQVGYSAVHVRLRLDRGSAEKYDCAHCGGRAAQWAFDHGGNPSVGALEYSTDPTDYIPLCAKCHRRFDSERA
jgi:hypothetical protein